MKKPTDDAFDRELVSMTRTAFNAGFTDESRAINEVHHLLVQAGAILRDVGLPEDGAASLAVLLDAQRARARDIEYDTQDRTDLVHRWKAMAAEMSRGQVNVREWIESSAAVGDALLIAQHLAERFCAGHESVLGIARLLLEQKARRP